MIRGGGMVVFLMGAGVAAGALLGEDRLVAPLLIGFVLAFVAQSLLADGLPIARIKETVGAGIFLTVEKTRSKYCRRKRSSSTSRGRGLGLRCR